MPRLVSVLIVALALALGAPAFSATNDPLRTAVSTSITNATSAKNIADLVRDYLARFYDDPALDDQSGFAVDGEIDWSVTPITSISFSASSNILETTLTGSTGAATTSAEIGLSHKLRRNLTLQAFGGLTYIDYNGVSRNDQIYSAGLGAEWKMTRRLTLKPSYG